jgi:hypothetical protein
VRFIVELRATVDGVEGEVTSELEPMPRRFSGWLELLRLIEPPGSERQFPHLRSVSPPMRDVHAASRRLGGATAMVTLHDLAQVPAAEVSALATAVVGRGRSLAAVADDTVAVFVSPVGTAATGPEVNDWRTIDLSGVYAPPEQGSNFEGVALDSSGLAVVLAEYPARLLLVALDEPSTARVIEIDLPSVARAIGERFDEAEFRFLGEGIVLLERGHILVGREKNPMGLIEFSPNGSVPLGLRHDAVLPDPGVFSEPSSSRYGAVAWWPLTSALEDISDIAVHQDRLYLLSDQSAAIARLPLDDPPLGVALTPELVCELPTTDGKRKDQNPEGLTFIDGVAVVAFDRAEGESNLATIQDLAL